MREEIRRWHTATASHKLDVSPPEQNSFSRGLACSQPGRWKHVGTGLSGKETRRLLLALSRRYGVSESAVTVTAALLLLSRYHTCNEIGVIVVTVDGSSRPAQQPVRIEVSHMRRIGEVLQDVDRQIVASLHAPREKTSDAMLLPRVVVLVHAHTDGATTPDFIIKSLGNSVLAFECCYGVKEHQLRVHYRELAHARWLARQIGRHLARVIAVWLSGPDVPIGRSCLLDESETAAVLRHSLGPGRRYPLDQSLLHLFDEQVRCTPDRVAVIGPNGDGLTAQISYRELQARVNSLACRLMSLGASMNVPVGVHVERSINFVATLLAILRTGATYIPLDCSYPGEHLRFVLEDTHAPLLIADRAITECALPLGTRVIQIDGEDAGRDVSSSFPEVATTDPCMIMYTSGSTGRPKGVVHCQRQIINRLHWMWEAYPFQDGDVLAQRSPVSVMPSVWELLGGVLAGVPTVVIPDSVLRRPGELAGLLALHRVTFVTLTPSLLRLLLDARDQAPAWPHDLRVVVIGGEPLTQALYRDFRAAFPAATMVNDFGTTEVNTVLHVALPPTQRGNIGECGYQPIANVSTFILDDLMRVVPFGAEGELCIAGVPVALQYLNHRDLTSERFVDVRPGGRGTAMRVYRTGDMGYMTPSGRIHITGRRDHQVKINGMRVELGEVECILSLHPAVAECIVIDRLTSDDHRILHAYMVPRAGEVPESHHHLRVYLRKRLPQHMVPQRFEWVAALPRRPNGKLDRLALHPPHPSSRPSGTDGGTINHTHIARTVRETAAHLLEVEPGSIDPHFEFYSLGFDSIAIIVLAKRLSDVLDRPISPATLFDHPTVTRLTDYLISSNPLRVDRTAQAADQIEGTAAPSCDRIDGIPAIALIGMSGRFPGADNIDCFWDNLCAGVECITTAAPRRWDAETVYDPDPARERRSYSKWGGFLAGADEFDPWFFGLSPAEARAMDPQQRLCLMESWHALEDAGYTGQCLGEHTVGVFVGARESDYPTLIAGAGWAPNAHTLLGNDLSLLAARISYFSDLHGPSLVVDTACSSALVALDLACRSLRDGECTMALAGGVCVTNDPDFYVATSNLGVFSPTGTCRAFDEGADGFVHGEGVGFVVLKPLSAAIADRDHIYAVIRGTVVNQDGRSNGITAPNGDAQSRLQESLYRKAAIDPDTISYVEAHGTGTQLGDPIEVQALTRSFRRFTARSQYCAIGSVKTNIGHLTAAAGVAGLIKTALCLYHRELVPSLHFNRPNSLIDFASSPFYINTVHRAWNGHPGHIRRAAINAFGIGGTNAHCVLEEAPPIPVADSYHSPAYLVPITAPTSDAVVRVVGVLQRWVEARGRNHTLRDLSYSLLVGRRLFEHGYVFVVRDMDELRLQLGEVIEGRTPPTVKPLVVGHDANVVLRDLDEARASLTDLLRPRSSAALSQNEYIRHILKVADEIALGLRTDWHPLYENESPRRIRVPTYPFASQRFWVDPPPSERPRETLKAADEASSKQNMYREIAEALGELLGIDPATVSPDHALSRYGLDSIGALSLKHALERRIGVGVPLELLLGGSHIDELASRLRESRRDDAPEGKPVKPSSSLIKEALPAMRTSLSDAPGESADHDALHPRWISDTEPQRPFPLTDLQAAYFVAKRMPEADPVGAHMYLEFAVADLDVNRLEHAWRRLLEIHPMLRARVDGNGTQCVQGDVPTFSIVRYEVTTDSEALDRHLQAVRAEMSHWVYQPTDWPLFDIRVTQAPGSKSRVHVSMDSWIVDGTSADLIYRQWRLLYDSPDAELPAPEAKFRDFVLSIKAFEGGVRHRCCVDYWAHKLQNVPDGPQLPYRRVEAVPKVDAHRRCRLQWVCAPEVWRCIKTVVAAEGVSLSVALLGLFAERLYAFGWGERFSLILTLYNRPSIHPQIAHIVGPFGSTGIFLVDRRPGVPFAERLRDYQQQLWQDLDHGYVSGVAAMRGARFPRIPVVFTSTVGIANAAQSGPTWLDEVDYAVSQTPGIDLHFQAYERADGLHVAWDVAYGRFEPRVIDVLFEDVCLSISQLAIAGLTEVECSLSARTLDEHRRTRMSSGVPMSGNDIPLTPLQQTYLAHRLFDMDEQPACVYREFDLVSFDPRRLQAAINGMIRRSPVLRSVLHPKKVRLVEFPIGSFPIQIDDLRGLDADQVLIRLEKTRADMVNALVRERGWPHFTIRASLLDGDVARLHMLLDLVLFDGYSVWLFYDELFRHYTGVEEVARPQSIYGDYALTRERYRESGAYAADRIFWARKFQALPPGPQWPWPTAELPTRQQRYVLEIGHWRALKDDAARRGVPPVAVLLTTYAEVLRRWSRCERFTVVAVDYGQRRVSSDLAQAYGDCSSLAWLPYEGGASVTFEERLRAIADTLTRDWLHEWGNPFEALRGVAGRDGRTPSFAAVLTNCLGAPAHTRVGITEVHASSSTPGVDIDQMVVETERGLATYWQIRVDRIPAAMATAMIDEYRYLLEELATGDVAWQRPLAELGGRAVEGDRAGGPQWPAEQPTAVSEWNRTDAEFDREQCVHRLFERRVAQDPDRVALISDECTLTYGQLERRANQLARFLRRQGVGRGRLVGVLLDRSFDTIAALLAILKAGAGYVPLSITDPRNRIASILNRADPMIVITRAPHAALLDGERRRVLLDEQMASIEADDSDSVPAIDSRSDDIAYVIFTSGSTGEPKGVVVRHRPVVNLIEWAEKTFDLNHDDRVIFVNSLGFDLSVFDVFGMLAYGASIRIISDEDRWDAPRLASLLLREPITIWNSAPAYLQFVMPSLKAKAYNAGDRRLRFALLSGDRIPLSLPADVRSVFPSVQVVNLGGATEATVWSNYFPISEIDPVWTSIPYGRPIQNARYYILDDYRQPCPIGTAGHLYISGECLSSGYLNAPELTAQRFLPDPFHERPGMTMYHTGDLARFMADGNIEFLGRVDDQVKVRGFRIELGEVEAALAKAGLESPVAVVRVDRPSTEQIVGFGFSSSMRGRVTDDSFWQRLRGYLPEYMIPTHVYALLSLPTTENGKVDRKMLAKMPLDDLPGLVASETVERAASPATRDASIPRGPVPRTNSLVRLLCSMVAEILALDPAGIQVDTDLGMLGAGSLQFAILSAKLGEATGKSISPAKLFHCASVGAIVDTLEERFPEIAAALLVDSGAAADPSIKTTGELRDANGAERHAATTLREEAFSELAIIGIHCVMPQADRVSSFWTNIRNGRHCVELIPCDRWDWRAWYGDSNREENVTTVNRAGFIQDINKFDAAFFGISPREAELMDPRQRMLLEGVWKTLEDAGYRPTDLRGEPVGIFVGAIGDEYASLLQQAHHPIDRFSLTGTGRSFLANRVSYYFDWRGPSEVIDTTCSSSLVAMHNAARAIQRGDCSMAIVGGINIMIDPFPHISLTKVGVLSPDGACKTFDASANGYMRGEGLGLLLLKPLGRSEADHDHIHAVVSGTAVNHGGRANALTAPNPRAQSLVIIDAHRRSAVDPRQIGYIETHGTGTPLGDPIEIEGIKEAFATLYRDRGQALPTQKQISIGSVKTSIGHLEAAAGVAGLIKVILMLRHQMLPPLVHLKTLNPQIDVDDTPFFFQTEARDWDAPLDENGRRLPRAAGVSSFGFGGVNAHVVVREYLPSPPIIREPEDQAPNIIPLSAHSREQLADYARLMRDALVAGRNDLRLEDVVFTLRVGREAFNERAVIIAHSIDQMVEQLDAIFQGDAVACRDVFFGNARRDAKNLEPDLVEASPEENISLLPQDLARAWVSGFQVDWRRFYRERHPWRVPLPTYPFARVSHWPEALRIHRDESRSTMLVESTDPQQPGYFLTLTGDEPFINHHRIDGARIMPAAAYLAFAADVAERRLGKGPIRIAGLVWTRPLRFVDPLPRRLQIMVTMCGDACRVVFCGEEAGEPLEYSSATLESAILRRLPARVDLDSLNRRCLEQYSARDCYNHLKDAGIDLGPTLQVIRTLRRGKTEALAHIVLPDAPAIGADDSRLHPAIVDGAFQAELLHQVLGSSDQGGARVYMPFTIRQVIVRETLPRECYAYVVLTKNNISAKALRKYDVALLGPDGEVLLELEECTGLPLTLSASSSSPSIQLFREQWRAADPVHPRRNPDAARPWHLLVGLPALADAFARAGECVLANAILPGDASSTIDCGSAVPWDGVLDDLGDTPGALVLWYDRSKLASLPLNEQLRFGFDTIFDLTKRLLAMRQLKRCCIIVCLISTSRRDDAPTLEALSGFAKAVQHESPKLKLKLLQVVGVDESSLPTAGDALLQAVKEASESEVSSVEHRFDLMSGAHELRHLVPVGCTPKSEVLRIEQGSVYLISGGAGAIGRHLTRALLKQGAKVALLGRSPAVGERGVALKALGPTAHAQYFQANVTDDAAVRRALAEVRARLGEVRGVFHCAGVAGGRLLLFRSLEEAREIVSAKILGTTRLDEATRADPLDFFVLFSSLASVTGPVGASDYAYANRYTDLFAAYRNSLASRGLRRGSTLTMSWPMWSDGGMPLPRQVLNHLRSSGLEPIDSTQAIKVLARCMTMAGGHYICAHGNPAKFEVFLASAYPASVEVPLQREEIYL